MKNVFILVLVFFALLAAPLAVSAKEGEATVVVLEADITPVKEDGFVERLLQEFCEREVDLDQLSCYMETKVSLRLY